MGEYMAAAYDGLKTIPQWLKHFNLDASESDLRRYRRHAKGYGIKITGIARMVREADFWAIHEKAGK